MVTPNKSDEFILEFEVKSPGINYTKVTFTENNIYFINNSNILTWMLSNKYLLVDHYRDMIIKLQSLKEINLHTNSVSLLMLLAPIMKIKPKEFLNYDFISNLRALLVYIIYQAQYDKKFIIEQNSRPTIVQFGTKSRSFVLHFKPQFCIKTDFILTHIHNFIHEASMTKSLNFLQILVTESDSIRISSDKSFEILSLNENQKNNS